MAVESVCCPVVPGGDGGMATVLRRVIPGFFSSSSVAIRPRGAPGSIGGNGGTVALACWSRVGGSGQHGVAMASVVYPSLGKANARCVTHLAGSMGGRAQEIAGVG